MCVCVCVCKFKTNKHKQKHEKFGVGMAYLEILIYDPTKTLIPLGLITDTMRDLFRLSTAIQYYTLILGFMFVLFCFKISNQFTKNSMIISGLLMVSISALILFVSERNKNKQDNITLESIEKHNQAQNNITH